MPRPPLIKYGKMSEPGSENSQSEVSGGEEAPEEFRPPALVAGRWFLPPPEGYEPASVPGGILADFPGGESPVSGRAAAGAVADEASGRRGRRVMRRLFRELVIPLAIAFIVALAAQATVAKPYQIPSGSMLPTIQLQDRIIANRLVYHFSSIQRGDIIVFEPPEALDPETPFVKRVIGLPGDTVEIRGGEVLVNGDVYEAGMATKPSYTMNAETVPEGMLFVLGDNRNESYDSHRWGFVPVDNVIGRAEVIYWPPEHLSLLGE